MQPGRPHPPPPGPFWGGTSWDEREAKRTRPHWCAVPGLCQGRRFARRLPRIGCA